jgi:hypothetical protein
MNQRSRIDLGGDGAGSADRAALKEPDLKAESRVAQVIDVGVRHGSLTPSPQVAAEAARERTEIRVPARRNAGDPAKKGAQNAASLTQRLGRARSLAEHGISTPPGVTAMALIISTVGNDLADVTQNADRTTSKTTPFRQTRPAPEHQSRSVIGGSPEVVSATASRP